MNTTISLSFQDLADLRELLLVASAAIQYAAREAETTASPDLYDRLMAASAAALDLRARFAYAEV